MVPAKYMLLPHIVENTLPLSNSNNCTKPGVPYFSSDSGFSYATVIVYIPLPIYACPLAIFQETACFRSSIKLR